MKKLISLLTIVGLLIGCSVGPFSDNDEGTQTDSGSVEFETLSQGHQTITFHGDIYSLQEEIVFDPYPIPIGYKLTVLAATNIGDLTYKDFEPLPTTIFHPEFPSEAAHIPIPESTWDFGDGKHFEATGVAVATGWLYPFRPTPKPHMRANGSFDIDITEGTWGGKSVLGGHASMGLTLDKWEHESTGSCMLEPCDETARGTVNGVIFATND
jgi:hypothetical protein